VALSVTAHVSKVAQEVVEGLGPLVEEAQQQIEQQAARLDQKRQCGE